MRRVDLSLVLSDGLSTYAGGPKMNVMNRITHEWSHGRYLPPAVSAADRVMMINEHIDLPNVDHPGDRSFPVHMALLPAGILIYENIANLERVPVARFQFLGLPLRLSGATGSPVRAVAIID